jgi:hypothetical protein
MYASITSTRTIPLTMTVAIPPGDKLLDIYPGAVAAYSFRKLRTEYAGSAVRIRRSSDSTEQDIGFVGTDFDTASAATFIGGGTGFITTWYDQSGNAANALQPTAASQPSYNATGIGGKPSIVTDGSDDLLRTGVAAVTIGAQTKASMFFIAMTLTGDTAANSRFCSYTANGQANDWDNTGSGVFALWDAVSTPAFRNSSAIAGIVSFALDTGYRFSTIWDGTNVTTYRNDLTNSAANALAFGATGSVNIAANSGFDGFMKGRFSEVILWASNQATNRAAIDANQSVYWGV